MKKIIKGKGFLKNVRVFSMVILFLGTVSMRANAQNYPGQNQPGQQPGNPTQTIPPPLNPPTTPNTPGSQPTPNLNLPTPSQLQQDTMHLYNPVKPDTGHLKLQMNRTTSFNNYELNPPYFEEDNSMVCGELCIRKIS